MTYKILSHIQQAKKNDQQLLAILIDPDKISLDDVQEKVRKIEKSAVDIVLVGGSLLFSDHLDALLLEIKKHANLPIVLFPGNVIQISPHADGILFLSLLSGRNPEYLIGNQVIAAPILKQTELEIIATSYLLIESGRETTASYISNTKPIPRDKPEIAMATALAGEMMGHQVVYLDGGSGAQKPVPAAVIEHVAKHSKNPIIVGGGVRTKDQLQTAYKAGATLVVIGTAFEENNQFLNKL